MLLYLFAVCREPGVRFRTEVELDGDKYPIPAGIVYLSSNLPKLNLNDYSADEKEILELCENKLLRSGLIPDDEAIIKAYSHSETKELLLGLN